MLLLLPKYVYYVLPLHHKGPKDARKTKLVRVMSFTVIGKMTTSWLSSKYKLLDFAMLGLYGNAN